MFGDRRIRNQYAQLLLHMLKRGSLEGPFTARPDVGPLPPLPAYMVRVESFQCHVLNPVVAKLSRMISLLHLVQCGTRIELNHFTTVESICRHIFSHVAAKEI